MRLKLENYIDYEVSKDGYIYSVKYNKERKLKPNIGKDGYIRVKLYNKNVNKTYLLHRLIAQMFIPNPQNKKEVNHIDGDKLNNNVLNLEWCTPSENVVHSYKMGLQSKKGLYGEKNPISKLKSDDVINIFRSEENHYLLGEKYNVSFATIYDIKMGRTWKQLTSKI